MAKPFTIEDFRNMPPTEEEIEDDDQLMYFLGDEVAEEPIIHTDDLQEETHQPPINLPVELEAPIMHFHHRDVIETENMPLLQRIKTFVEDYNANQGLSTTTILHRYMNAEPNVMGDSSGYWSTPSLTSGSESAFRAISVRSKVETSTRFISVPLFVYKGMDMSMEPLVDRNPKLQNDIDKKSIGEGTYKHKTASIAVMEALGEQIQKQQHKERNHMEFITYDDIMKKPGILAQLNHLDLDEVNQALGFVSKLIKFKSDKTIEKIGITYKKRSGSAFDSISMDQQIIPDVQKILDALRLSCENLSNQTKFYINGMHSLALLTTMADKISEMSSPNLFTASRLTKDVVVLMFKASVAVDRQHSKVYYKFISKVGGIINPYTRESKKDWYVSDLEQLKSEADSYGKMISFSVLLNQATVFYYRLTHYMLKPKMDTGLPLSNDWFLWSKDKSEGAKIALMASKSPIIPSAEVLNTLISCMILSRQPNYSLLFSDKMTSAPVQSKKSQLAQCINKFVGQWDRDSVYVKYSVESLNSLLNYIEESKELSQIGFESVAELKGMTMQDIMSSKSSNISYVTISGEPLKQGEVNVQLDELMKVMDDQHYTEAEKMDVKADIIRVLSTPAVIEAFKGKKKVEFKRLTGMVWLSVSELSLKYPETAGNPISLGCKIMKDSQPIIVIFTKPQTPGTREISIMNADAKVVMGIEEILMLSVSKTSIHDFINKEDEKKQKIHTMIRDFHRHKRRASCWFYTIDFKAWNQNMHTPMMASICRALLDKLYPETAIGSYVQSALLWFSTKRLLIDSSVLIPFVKAEIDPNPERLQNAITHNPDLWRAYKTLDAEKKIDRESILSGGSTVLEVPQMFCQGIAGAASSACGVVILIYCIKQLEKLFPHGSYDFAQTSDDVLLRMDFIKSQEASTMAYAKEFMSSLDLQLNNFGLKLSRYKCSVSNSGTVIFNSKVYNLADDLEAEFYIQERIFVDANDKIEHTNPRLYYENLAKVPKAYNQLMSSDFEVRDYLRHIKQVVCDIGLLTPNKNAETINRSELEYKENNPSDRVTEDTWLIRLVSCMMSRGLGVFPKATIDMVNGCGGFVPSVISGSPDVRGFEMTPHISPMYIDICRALMQEKRGCSYMIQLISKMFKIENSEALHAQEINMVDKMSMSQMVARYRDLSTIVNKTLVHIDNAARLSRVNSAGKSGKISVNDQIKIAFRPCIRYQDVEVGLYALVPSVMISLSDSERMMIDNLEQTYYKSNISEGMKLVTAVAIETPEKSGSTMDEILLNGQAVCAITSTEEDLIKNIEIVVANNVIPEREQMAHVRRFYGNLMVLKDCADIFYDKRSRLPMQNQAALTYMMTSEPIAPWVIAQSGPFGIGALVRHAMERVHTQELERVRHIYFMRDDILVSHLRVNWVYGKPEIDVVHIERDRREYPGFTVSRGESDDFMNVKNALDLSIINASSFVNDKINWAFNLTVIDGRHRLRKTDQKSEETSRYYQASADKFEHKALLEKSYQHNRFIANQEPLPVSFVSCVRRLKYKSNVYLANFPEDLNASFLQLCPSDPIMQAHLRTCYLYMVCNKPYSQNAFGPVNPDICSLIKSLVGLFPYDEDFDYQRIHSYIGSVHITTERDFSFFVKQIVVSVKMGKVPLNKIFWQSRPMSADDVKV